MAQNPTQSTIAAKTKKTGTCRRTGEYPRPFRSSPVVKDEKLITELDEMPDGDVAFGALGFVIT